MQKAGAGARAGAGVILRDEEVIVLMAMSEVETWVTEADDIFL